MSLGSADQSCPSRPSGANGCVVAPVGPMAAMASNLRAPQRLPTPPFCRTASCVHQDPQDRAPGGPGGRAGVDRQCGHERKAVNGGKSVATGSSREAKLSDPVAGGGGEEGWTVGLCKLESNSQRAVLCCDDMLQRSGAGIPAMLP